jgi:hypothetical protein
MDGNQETSRRSSFFQKIKKSDNDDDVSASSRGTLTSKTSDAPRKSLFNRAKELLNRKSYLSKIERGLLGKHDARPSESDNGSVASSSMASHRSMGKAVSGKIPVPLVAMYSPQVWAFLGRFDEIRAAVNNDKSILSAKFDWLQDDKHIEPDAPPAHLPELVRNALVDGLECQVSISTS